MPTGTHGKLRGRVGEMDGTKRLAGNETEWPAELIRVKVTVVFEAKALRVHDSGQLREWDSTGARRRGVWRQFAAPQVARFKAGRSMGRMVNSAVSIVAGLSI